MNVELSDDERLEYVRTVNRQGARLQRFVKDLLTVSKMERQTVDARPVPVQVADAVDQVLTELDVEQVEAEVDDELAALVDRDHLLQIVGNLLSNAAKYGRPPLTVTATSASGRVEIVVRDHGPGVPESFVPELFAEFTRAPDVSGKPGTGLGLAIVRRLVEANDGTVDYRPATPEGACFTVTLPAAPATSPS